jgi:tetratricopeptide (TPR) repeat protein
VVLLARAALARAGRAANREGRALVARAHELDPDYAMAYVVESELEEQRATLGWMEDPADGLRRAERAARHALTLDDPGANARAHAQLGRIHAIRREYEPALAESERAWALNPSDTFVAEVRGDVLMWAGRTQEAVALMEGALRLDPAGRRSPVRQAIVIGYFAAGRYPEALAACDRALGEYPESAAMHVMRAAILSQAGRLDEARLAADEVRRLQPNFPVAQFGDRFSDPATRERFQAALKTVRL